MSGLSYGELRRRVGRFLGFDRNPANWGEREVLDVQDCIDSGLDEFYRPTRVPGEHWSYQWSFLRPTGFVTLVPGEWDYDMPDDFAGFDGPLYYVGSDQLQHTVRLMNEGFIHNLRQRESLFAHSDTVEYAALTPKRSDGISTSIYQLQVWPKPDRQITLQFKQFVTHPRLREDHQVPYGAANHAQTIIQACIAAAELMLTDVEGPQYERFIRNLIASRDFDARASSPMTLGYNGDGSCRHDCECEPPRSIGGLILPVQSSDTPPVEPGGGGDPIPSFPPPDGALVTHDEGTGEEFVITDEGEFILPHDP